MRCATWGSSCGDCGAHGSEPCYDPERQDFPVLSRPTLTQSVGECLSENTAVEGYLLEPPTLKHEEDERLSIGETVPETDYTVGGHEKFETPWQRFPIMESAVADDPPVVALDDPGAQVRVTSAKTGGQKGRNLLRFALIPWEATRALARHYGLGAFKYDDDNWRKGYDWSLSADALERHWNAWKSGESTTVERFEKDGQKYAFETHHLIAVAWQAFTLFCFELWGVGKDDVHKGRSTE